jgi:Aldolase/RraA
VPVTAPSKLSPPRPREADARSPIIRPRRDHLLLPACGAALPPENHNFKTVFYQAIERGADRYVLVLASNGYTEASLAAGSEVSRAQNHRLAGILVDGHLRDLRRARALRPSTAVVKQCGGG